jgi:hypothetical protein
MEEGESMPLYVPTYSMQQSATAVAIAASGTVATVGLGESRLNPAASVTGIIMASGTTPGQQCTVTNESAFYIQFAASGTSHVAYGVATVIPPTSSETFIWDSGTSLWYSIGDYPAIQSSSAFAIGAAGAVDTSATIARLAPAAAVTGITMNAGTYGGQLCFVVNESAVGNTITFNQTPATARVSGSANMSSIIGLQGRLFTWDTGTSLWYCDEWLGGQSSTAVVTGGTTTIATNSFVSRVAPAGAVTVISLAAGIYPGQQCIIVNEAVAANTITLSTTPATARVADSATEPVIAGLTARKFVWDSSTALWYRCF